MTRLFPAIIPARTLFLLISEILLIFGSYWFAAYYLKEDMRDFLNKESGMTAIIIVVVSILIGLYLQDLYSEIHIRSGIVFLQKFCLVIGIACILQGMLSYLSRNGKLSIPVMPVRIMAYGSFLAMGSVLVWRSSVLRMVGRESVLLVGGSPVLIDIASYIVEHPETGMAITGYVDDVHQPDAALPGGKMLGQISSLREVVNATKPGRVVVGMFERRNRAPMGELLELRFGGHIIEEASVAYERICSRVCTKELRPSQLIFTGELGPRRLTLLYQNLINRVVAVIGIIVSLPIMALAGILVRVFSSPGPILYRQVRIGMNNVPFTLYKFRSMRVDAEAGTGAIWAAKDDPRVTGIGRVLRRTRLDELPQLFNVLRGEMSVVGPRPERPEFVKALSEKIPYYRQRHCVRPGITGWAQINYKYGDTLEDTITKLEYDLFYIKNMSLSLDTYIIFHTVKAMLLSRGAQ
jgi:sugar transferase (PEP-CTERM system associated)